MTGTRVFLAWSLMAILIYQPPSAAASPARLPHVEHSLICKKYFSLSRPIPVFIKKYDYLIITFFLCSYFD